MNNNKFTKKAEQKGKILTEKVFIDTIKELRREFATKEDLGKELKDFQDVISRLFYKKMSKIEDTQDKILLKLETWEIENTVGTNQIRKLRVDVDDHGKRLVKLETKN